MKSSPSPANASSTENGRRGVDAPSEHVAAERQRFDCDARFAEFALAHARFPKEDPFDLGIAGSEFNADANDYTRGAPQASFRCSDNAPITIASTTYAAVNCHAIARARLSSSHGR